MRWTSATPILGVALVVTLCLAAPAAAAPARSHPADVLHGVSQVEWVPTQEFAGFRLTVSGPEGVSTLSFEPGENPRFDLASLAGDIDGIYTWELTARPLVDEGTARALAESRVSNADGNRKRPASLPPRESLIQTGSFRVASGAIVQPDAEETPGGQQRIVAASGQRVTAADQVIPDDLIVQSSLCVGFDCVNNENFGFDTIRLKENNLRINFADTSAGSFPSNDWRLVANDSANGGRNVFYLEDSNTGREVVSVEAGAPSNALWVDSTGNIGAGTSTPVLQLHIKDGNTPGIRLEQDNSSGFTAQTWDVAGNEANFFVRDVTGGSLLSFRIRPGAPSSSIDIAGDGDVGIGTASPGTMTNGGDDAAVHIRRTSDADSGLLIERATGAAASDVLLELRNNGTPRFDMVDTNSGTNWRFEASGAGFNINDLADGGTAELVLQTDGDLIIEGDLTANGTNYPSSRTLKEGFSAVDNQEVLGRLAAVPVSLWTYKSDAHKRPHIGPVTEDFSAAFDFLEADGTLSTIDLHGVALAAIKGLNELVTEKDARITELEQRLQILEARLTTE
jgi:hypothetical protein